MAQDLWYDKIDRNVDWGGDESTNNLPVAGSAVQEFIKSELNEKIGIIYHDEVAGLYLCFANDDDKNVSDRFQLVVNGAEIVNGYSELVNPVEQEQKLSDQASLKEAGDEEAMEMDYDYISAMEYGMPPISGWGMGIDRIV